MICYLIDDDEDDRDFFALALQEVDRDIELRTSDNAEEALRALRNESIFPDIIFLDLNMPRIDGWQCLRMLREIRHVRDVPVIIYSTAENRFNVQGKSDFSHFLTKQSKISELAKKLREIFSKITV